MKSLSFIILCFVLCSLPDFLYCQREMLKDDCTWNSFKLYGNIQFVETGEDIRVSIVDSFPDLEVKIVDSFPDECGEWKIVDSFPDLKVKIVGSFPDLKIKFVESFPGLYNK